jgi:hypothetical protein
MDEWIKRFFVILKDLAGEPQCCWRRSAKIGQTSSHRHWFLQARSFQDDPWAGLKSSIHPFIHSSIH